MKSTNIPTRRRLMQHCLSLLCLFLLIDFPSPVSAQSCYDNFYDIYEQESIVTDTSFPRRYIICPRQIYEIATVDFNGDIKEPISSGALPPLPIRPNMTIRCGDQGSRDNLCWLAGGDFHMDGTATRGITDETVEGVSIEGFVFIGARKHSLWVNKPGDITFRDCEWRDFVNSQVPIMMDYYDASKPSNKLVTTFNDCEFRDNRYFGMGSMSSLIYTNSPQNELIVKQSLFQYNDMIFNNTRPDTHSFLIEALGPTLVENTCFQDNLVGSSDIVVFGASYQHQMNFASNSSGSLCEFASHFENIQQFDSFRPICIEATSSVCERYETGAPSATPSSAPTPVAPSFSPTQQPTTTPYPTGKPSEGPSLRPSELGETESPTVFPVDFVWPETDPPSAATSLRQTAIGLAIVTLSFCIASLL